MTPPPLLPWTPAKLRREIQAWIAYYAHALPRPPRDLDAPVATASATSTSLHAPPEPLTEAMVLDALDRRLAESLASTSAASVHGHADAVLAVGVTANELRIELGLIPRIPRIPRIDAAPSPAATEAASDLLERSVRAAWTHSIVGRPRARAA